MREPRRAGRWLVLGGALCAGLVLGCGRTRDPHVLYGLSLPGTDNTISPAELVRVADRDGDGADELAVGIPTSNRLRGTVRLHSGRDGRRLSGVDGERERDTLGASLQRIGDIDRDGVDEIVSMRRGEVSTVLGPERSWRVDVAAGGFATSCALVGDVDGDGGRDVVIASTLRSGQVLDVLSGRDGTTLDRIAWDVPTTEPSWSSRRYRVVVRGTGDLDGDGVDDYVLARPLAGPIEVTVRSSASGLVLARTSLDVAAHGFALLPCGDRDGDGHGELASASPGRIAILSPRTCTWTELTGPFAGELVDAGADLDADGVDDFLLRTTHGAAPATPFDCFGTFLVVSGRDGRLLASLDVRLVGGPPSGCFLGDVDGDRRSEVALALPGRDRVRVIVVSGAALLESGGFSSEG